MPCCDYDIWRVRQDRETHRIAFIQHRRPIHSTIDALQDAVVMTEINSLVIIGRKGERVKISGAKCGNHARA